MANILPLRVFFYIWFLKLKQSLIFFFKVSRLLYTANEATIYLHVEHVTTGKTIEFLNLFFFSNSKPPSPPINTN